MLILAFIGWGACIRWADKVLHSDFVHTAAGQPVYLECTDNYLDMRERFAALLPPFRQAMGLAAEAVIPCVLDRLADLDEQLQPRSCGEIVLVAIFGDAHALDQYRDC